MPRPMKAELLRDLARGALYLLGDARHARLLQLGDDTGHADRGLDRPVVIKDRSGDAAHAVAVLLVVDGVALLADLFQLAGEAGEGGDGLRSAPGQFFSFEDVLHHFGGQVGGERLADGGGVQVHAAADPGVHLDEAGGIGFFDVHGAAAVEDGEVGAEAGLFDQLAQHGLGDLTDVEASKGAMTEADDSESKVVFARFAVAANVSRAFEGAQDVAGRAFGDLNAGGDLGVRDAGAALSDHVQDVECADHGDGRRLFDRGCAARHYAPRIPLSEQVFSILN
jgi:hypothetical protein